MLFIVSDDLNTALDCYGHPLVQTPHIARLAARGVRFDRAYCQFPLCNPSRASFLSGRRPDSTRVYTLQTPVRRHIENAVFLPELFRRNGYFTAHAGKVFHTGEAMEDPRSWDEELREFGKQPPAKAVIESEKAQGPIGHSMEWMTLRSKDEETPDGAVARRAVEMMEKSVRAGKPFLRGGRFPPSAFALRRAQALFRQLPARAHTTSPDSAQPYRQDSARGHQLPCSAKADAGSASALVSIGLLRLPILH